METNALAAPVVTFRAIAATVAWAGLILRYAFVARANTLAGLPGATLIFLGFFTILSNIVVALCWSVPLLWPRSAAGRFFGRYPVRTAAALYIAVTGLIFLVLLRGLEHLRGWEQVGDSLLHQVTPVLFLFDWVVLTPKRRLPPASSLVWALFPFLYAVTTLVRGALGGSYPYPFVNVAELGWPLALRNVILVGLLFLALGEVLRRVGNRWARENGGRPEP